MPSATMPPGVGTVAMAFRLAVIARAIVLKINIVE